MPSNCFLPADILLPKVDDLSKWAVIACDQFTSQPEYWERVRDRAGDAPSALRLILPEAELNGPNEANLVAQTGETMKLYQKRGLFQRYPESFVYVEKSEAKRS